MPCFRNCCHVQEWDKKKQAEAKAKALIYGWDDISAVKPDLYQKRFVYRLGQYFPPESTLEIDHASPEPEPASFMSRCVSCSDTLSTLAQRAEPLLRALQTALTA